MPIPELPDHPTGEKYQELDRDIYREREIAQTNNQIRIAVETPSSRLNGDPSYTIGDEEQHCLHIIAALDYQDPGEVESFESLVELTRNLSNKFLQIRNWLQALQKLAKDEEMTIELEGTCSGVYWIDLKKVTEDSSRYRQEFSRILTKVEEILEQEKSA